MTVRSEFNNIPAELKRLRQWVCWRSEADPARPHKPKKIPVNPLTGGNAQSSNPSTWTDFQTAVNASAQYSGIGFMFGSGYFGVDIDDVRGEIDEYTVRRDDAKNIVAEFIYTLETYAEYSVSGGGIHLICRGTLPCGGRRRGNVEMYQEKRFFIMTGKTASEYAEIRDCTDAIRPLHEKYIGGGNVIGRIGRHSTPEAAAPDGEVLDLIRKSKQSFIFDDLYSNGNWESYYTSQSEADLSLCNMLAFWCRKDPEQMDRLFRQSALMRDKWDRKQSGTTYGAITIQKAISGCENVYTPKESYAIRIGSGKEPPPKRYTFDDTGNADRLTDAFGDILRYSFPARKWLYYDGRRWTPDNEGTIRQMADKVVLAMPKDEHLYAADPDTHEAFKKHAKKSRSSSAKAAMIKETEHRVPILPSQMDNHHGLFNTPSGIVDLDTGEILEHNKDKFLTKMAGFDYTDNADCPQWQEFLGTIFRQDKDLIRYIQKAVGYSLTGYNEEQCAFILHGDGRNGKTTFIEVLREILGDYAVNIQAETLMVKRGFSSGSSELARLAGARFATSSEPNDGMRFDEGLIKQLTGGEPITAAKKYEDEIEFTPVFKLWISTNHKPIIRGTDDGIWRRIHLIPFSVQIPAEKVDKRLRYKLMKEAPAILRWAVDGCLLWKREGLGLPSCMKEAVKEYRSKMDIVGTFIEECCETGYSYTEQGNTLFKAYQQWARENNEYEMTNTKFGIEVGKRFAKLRRAGGVFYSGLRLLKQPYMFKVM